MAENKRPWNDENARYQTKVIEPGIADRITYATEESYRDGNVTEREPIHTVENERVMGVRVVQSIPHN